MDTLINTDSIGAQNEAWVYLCETAALDGADALRIDLPGRAPLAVFRVEQAYYVTDDTCTHGAASLSDGYLIGCEVECPFHDGRVDIRTGEPTKRPCTIPLRVYTVEVRGSAVYAHLPQ